MNKLEILHNILVKEAPLSTYVKSAAKFGARTTGSAIKNLKDPHASSMGTRVTKPVGDFLTKLGQKNDGGLGGNNKTTSDSTSNTSTTQQFKKKDRVEMHFGRQKYEGKVVTFLRDDLPVISVRGINNVQSVVLEPRGKSNVILYFYKEKIPKRKSQPVQFRSGQYMYMQQLKRWVIKFK